MYVFRRVPTHYNKAWYNTSYVSYAPNSLGSSTLSPSSVFSVTLFGVQLFEGYWCLFKCNTTTKPFTHINNVILPLLFLCLSFSHLDNLQKLPNTLRSQGFHEEIYIIVLHWKKFNLVLSFEVSSRTMHKIFTWFSYPWNIKFFVIIMYLWMSHPILIYWIAHYFALCFYKGKGNNWLLIVGPWNISNAMVRWNLETNMLTFRSQNQLEPYYFNYCRLAHIDAIPNLTLMFLRVYIPTCQIIFSKHPLNFAKTPNT